MKFSVLYLALFLPNLVFSQAPSFQSKGLLYLYDSDFSLNSQQSKTATKTGLDLVGAFKFPLRLADSQQPSELVISNSILSNHRSVALKKDRNLAYVLETRGSFTKGSNFMNADSLPYGNYVSVLNIADLGAIKPEYKFGVGENPTSISLDPSQKYLAISSSNPNGEIQIYELDDFGKPIRLLPRISHLEPGIISDLVWHPSGDYMIFLRNDTKEMGLVKIVKDGSTIIRLEQFGDIVKFEGNPITGIFSKNGDTFFVLDKGNKSKGIVFEVKLSFEQDGKHSFISKVEVEENPTAITIHPNGETLFVSNSLNSVQNGKSSLSIIPYKNGQFSSVFNMPLEGMLPSVVKIDKTGQNLAISFCQSFAFGKPFGSINFYTFTGGTNPKIQKQEGSINTPVGVHHIEVVPE